MECVALDVERLHLGIADFDTLFVGGGVERAFDLQAGLGGRRGNQLDPVLHPGLKESWATIIVG